MSKDHPPHFRAWITARDGRRIYAKDHGLKAFKIVKRKRED